MQTSHKLFPQRRHARIAQGMTLALTLVATMGAWGQTNNPMIDGLLNGLLRRATETQGSPTPAPAPTQAPGYPTGIPSLPRMEAPEAPAKPVLFHSKKELLEAARRGVFLHLADANSNDKTLFADTIWGILRHEYQVDPLPRECDWFGIQTQSLFGNVGQFYGLTLSDQGPSFFNTQINTGRFEQEIQQTLTVLKESRDAYACNVRVMGRAIPHNYRAALSQLWTEYSEATRQFVEEERSRRKQAYQVAQAQRKDAEREQQEVERQRQAQVRQEEQQRINAQAERIRQEQERKNQIEKARVGG